MFARRNFTIILAVVLCLLWIGFRFDGLPFALNGRFSDAVTSHFPAAVHLHNTLSQGGDSFIWSEMFFAGQPFAANPLNKTAYPLQWVVAVLPPLTHLNVMILVHLALAFAGMWCWTRAAGLRAEAAVFAAFAYLLSPRLIAHTGAGHLDVLYALAWFPWLMWAVVALVKWNDRLIYRILVLALVAALIFLADVRVSLFALVLAGVYAVSLLWLARRWRAVIALGAALFCALILTLSISLPLLGWMPFLSRSGLSPDEAGLFSLTPAQLIGLVFAPQGGNQETLTYVGLPVLILAVVAVIHQPRRHALWIAALIIAVFYAFGMHTPFWVLLTRLFPPLLWFRVPARAWFIVALVIPYLAGHGLQSLLDLTKRVRPLPYMIVALVLLVAGSFALVSGMMPTGTAVGLLTGGASCLLCAYRVSQQRQVRWLTDILLVLCAVDLVFTANLWMEWRDQSRWLTPQQIELAEALQREQAGRIYSPTYTLEQQTAAVYDLRLFGGVDPFQIEGISDAVRAGGGIDYDGYSVVAPPLLNMLGDAVETANQTFTPDTSVLGQWGVSHVVSTYPLNLDTLEFAVRVEAGYIYINRDPEFDPAGNTIPAWAEDWSGLPDADQVTSLNHLTLFAAAVGAGSFVLAVIAILAIAIVFPRTTGDRTTARLRHE